LRSDALAWLVLLAATPASVAVAGNGAGGALQWRADRADEFDVHLDPYDYASSPALRIREFPAAAVEWTIVDDRVVPLDQGAIATSHPGWDIAFQPGSARAGDGEPGVATIELPFALIEKGANCTHNGVLRWDEQDGRRTRVSYSITAETCAYFRFDMRGSLDATRAGGATASADDAAARFRENRDRRLPVRDVSALPRDYPAVADAVLTAVAPDDLTVFGYVVGGTHYRSNCPAREGNYAFCDDMLLPSYSLAKSLFGGLALMRLAAIVPGASTESIAGLVDACRRGWEGVTIGHALDMATGHFDSADENVDEASAAHVRFLYAKGHRERVRFACSHFPRREAPGQRFVYHSSDTYLAGTAMQALLDRAAPGNRGIYHELVAAPFWRPLAVSGALSRPLATRDPVAQPFTGWGLFLSADDIVRIGAWLGDAANPPVGLDRRLLDAALQRDADDRGLPAGAALHYNNGFWAWDAGPTVGCDAPVHVPFMSGYGGIAVVLFPNGVIYYHVSDGHEHRWRDAALVAHRIRSLCE